MGKNKRAKRVARGMIDASRTKPGHGALGLDRKALLKLSKTGTKDLIAAVIAENRAKAKKKK